jgi:5-(carboxyamino)imidazole ribonucleotide mutase
MAENKKLVAIIMGSDSDWPVMKFAAQMLADFDVPYEAQVISAHRRSTESNTCVKNW